MAEFAIHDWARIRGEDLGQSSPSNAYYSEETSQPPSHPLQPLYPSVSLADFHRSGLSTVPPYSANQHYPFTPTSDGGLSYDPHYPTISVSNAGPAIYYPSSSTDPLAPYSQGLQSTYHQPQSSPLPTHEQSFPGSSTVPQSERYSPSEVYEDYPTDNWTDPYHNFYDAVSNGPISAPEWQTLVTSSGTSCNLTGHTDNGSTFSAPYVLTHSAPAYHPVPQPSSQWQASVSEAGSGYEDSLNFWSDSKNSTPEDQSTRSTEQLPYRFGSGFTQSTHHPAHLLQISPSPLPPPLPTPRNRPQPEDHLPVSREVGKKDILDVVLQVAKDRAGHDVPNVFDSPKRPPRAPSRTASSSSLRSLKAGKPIATVTATCELCSENLAKLNFRSDTSIDAFAGIHYQCRRCIAKARPLDMKASNSKGEVESLASYEDTISAAIDELTIGHRPLEAEQQQKNLPFPGENDLPTDVRDLALICNVCVRTLGASLVAVPSDIVAELVCARCNAKYAACSDCGSGGGRVTTGRWRCIEMFPAERKTCQLSHIRSATLEELRFDVMRVDELSDELKDYLAVKCRRLYYETRLGTLARPEMLEAGDGLATTFEEVRKSTVDNWSMLEPILREDVTETQGVRRYIAIQTTELATRRGVPKLGTPAKGLESRMFRGFLLLEHDLQHGSLFYPSVTPWALSGTAFDANTKIAELTVARVRQDLALLNQQRHASDLPLYPDLHHQWLIVPFQTDNKIVTSLERRGYRALEEMLAKDSTLNAKAFPPHREIFIPSLYLRGYMILVRVYASADNLGGPAKVLPTKREIERSKRHKTAHAQ